MLKISKQSKLERKTLGKAMGEPNPNVHKKDPKSPYHHHMTLPFDSMAEHKLARTRYMINIKDKEAHDDAPHRPPNFKQNRKRKKQPALTLISQILFSSTFTLQSQETPSKAFETSVELLSEPHISHTPHTD